jgi:hypothetical protein
MPTAQKNLMMRRCVASPSKPPRYLTNGFEFNQFEQGLPLRPHGAIDKAYVDLIPPLRSNIALIDVTGIRDKQKCLAGYEVQVSNAYARATFRDGHYYAFEVATPVQ